MIDQLKRTLASEFFYWAMRTHADYTVEMSKKVAALDRHRA